MAALLFVLLVPTGIPLQAELAAIRFYQQVGSPVAGLLVTCRYELTCSHYAIQSLEAKGFWMGNLSIAGRLALCSPVGAIIDLARGV